MSDWDRFSDLMTTLAVASLAWVSSLLAPDLPGDTTRTAGIVEPSANWPGLMVGWAQSAEELPIEQVGEGTGEDVETLDEAEPPAEEVIPEEDIETLDQGSPRVTGDEDIELLDQGSPPATTQAPVTESPAPVAVTAAPVTTYVAPEPVASSGPVIPEGFGTGSVQVSTGSAGFPAGLGDCHVGAVTGRAFVGIDCGEGASFVGHAPSFDEFPFVVDEGFPFNRENVFTDLDETVVEDDAEIFVSAARGSPVGDDAATPEIRATGASSVEFAQETRNRKPRVETNSRKQTKNSNRGGSGDVEAAARNDANERVKSDTKGKRRDGGKDEKSRADAGETEKKSKERSDKKGKKARGSKNP